MVAETKKPSLVVGLCAIVTARFSAPSALRDWCATKVGPMPHNDPAYQRFQSDFQTLYEDAPLAYQSLDRQGVILLVNKAWLCLLGYERSDVIGRSFADFLTPASQVILTERLRALRADGCATNQAYEMVSAAGEAIPVRVDGRVVLGDTGGFERTHCIVQDMRAEVEARRGQAESEGRYQRLVELAREGIWEINAAAETVFVNPAMAAMLEYTVEEMQGRHLFDFMDERGRKISERNLERRERGIEEQHDFEFITRTGRRVITTMSTSPLYDADGNYSGALAGVMDVTERRRFEHEMLHTQKLESLGVLAGGIAHDFNNLLQTIMGNAELAREDLDEDASAQQSLQEIQQAARRAANLCREMLAYAGKGQVQLEDVDFASLVAEMGEILQISHSKKAEFTLVVEPDLPLITGDAAQLGQVVMNLITNASEALEDKEGQVRVTVQAQDLDAVAAASRFPLATLEPGLHVLLTVSDNGCGMNSETLGRIFDPFYTTKFAGRGLGLAAVLGIIKSHGGAIAVKSAVGQGTTITVALPAHPEGVPATVEDVAGEPGVSRSLTVLVAEDEQSVQRIVMRLMTRLGHTVHLAANGREALDIHRERGDQLDVVMLDLTMPVMDGKEAMKEIRQRDQQVPIIVCSGFPAEDIARGFGSDQPDVFLQKPFAIVQLHEALVSCTS